MTNYFTNDLHGPWHIAIKNLKYLKKNHIRFQKTRMKLSFQSLSIRLYIAATSSVQERPIFFVGYVHYSQDSQISFFNKTFIKNGTLFIYLKIILLQCFQFSAINGIQTDPKKKKIRDHPSLSPPPRGAVTYPRLMPAPSNVWSGLRTFFCRYLWFFDPIKPKRETKSLCFGLFAVFHCEPNPVIYQHSSKWVKRVIEWQGRQEVETVV